VTWRLPLAPLRSGPFGIWLLREPKNLLLELGPHLFGFVQDLFGSPEILHVEASHPVSLPGGGTRPQSLRILARVGHVDVTITLSLVETIDERTVTLHGSSGTARLNYATDSLIVTRDNTADLVANPLIRELSQAAQHLGEGVRNAVRQLLSLNQKSPYGLSFRGTFAPFYAAIRGQSSVEPRFSGDALVSVMHTIDQCIAMMPALPDPAPKKGTPRPTVMVIGGTGFIGRNLTRMLVARGYDVRVLSRGKTGPFDDIADHVETLGVSLYDSEALHAAMGGIDAVFNLAKSMDTTWQGCLENDVGVAVRVAEAVQAAGVKRLIYTGTIASYDMSDPRAVITEAVPFDTDMSPRNLYARSKAECEARLMAMHREQGLPLVIARPGIVVGAGGPLQHWGIGRWHGAGALKIWGHGRNNLPFVLADDVSDGLIRMMENDAAIGQSFNLVGEPMLSARGYFDAIHQRLGARLRLSSGSLRMMYLADGVKYLLKRHVLRRSGVERPSLADWKSRAHFAQFDNQLPKQLLGWQPETSRERFVDAAIGDANLFGF
jgi:nucleoside-diphosphate-sugar epimerase